MMQNRHLPPLVHVSSRWLVLAVLHVMFRFRVIGTRHIPKSGPLVIGSNHISNVDPIVIGASTRRQVRFMAKQELFQNVWIGRFLRFFGAFSVKRGGQDTAAIKYAIQVPHDGGCLVVFPEGHRSRDGKLGKGMAGVALIARKSGAPIVPVAVIGPYRWFGKVTVRFGEVLNPDPDDTNETLLEKLMSRIAQLVEEGHRR